MITTSGLAHLLIYGFLLGMFFFSYLADFSATFDINTLRFRVMRFVKICCIVISGCIPCPGLGVENACLIA